MAGKLKGIAVATHPSTPAGVRGTTGSVSNLLSPAKFEFSPHGRLLASVVAVVNPMHGDEFQKPAKGRTGATVAKTSILPKAGEGLLDCPYCAML
jgi:hypothetical protein